MMAPETSSVRTTPFLVFEGLDGSGKSTLIQAVATELKRRNQRFVTTREPGGTPLAEEIRKLLLRTDAEAPVAATELLLYAASRAQHVAKVIKPALEGEQWVLCDRFAASMVAFQCFARGLPRMDIDWLNRFAMQGTKPSLTVLLDLTVEESNRRQGGQGRDARDRMEQESRDFHEKVRQGYLSQAKEDPAGWLVLNAAESPDTLRTQVLAALEERRWLGSLIA
jgi:dTMP kinase